MKIISDPIDRRLLDDWQRGFPITPRPFAVLADTLDLTEEEVIARLTRMKNAGRVTRVGATCAPNAVSASTLAAVAAPPERLDEVAAMIGAEPGVNHNYHREDRWNLWFVATGPDRAHVDATLARIEARTELQVLDLRLVCPFNVDLGFRMTGGSREVPAPRGDIDVNVLRDGDREILQSLTQGMTICAAPFAALGAGLNRSEADILQRISALSDAGIISRLGVIVRHRALGWSANAMVVWDMPVDQVSAAGPALAALDGVTLCYERRPVAGIWPYRLYNMIHARSRSEALEVLDRALALPETQGARHKVLFSTRCFKQTGALISDRKEVAA
ncbi:AsnC family transcriptional regulator [Shimia biformata]|uniref:siroheme decarboxylase subunit beta n=1 Tax=Shimia biformata TaxID=1294299 RepID=UPI00194F3EFF|nr:AsnC family transcriptional regulator [Shimia biformata]